MVVESKVGSMFREVDRVSLSFSSPFTGSLRGMRRYCSGSRTRRCDVMRRCAHLGHGIAISV